MSSEPASTATCNDSTPTGRRGKLGGRAARSRTVMADVTSPSECMHAHQHRAARRITPRTAATSIQLESDQPGTGGHILTIKHQPGLDTWPLCVVAESTSIGFKHAADGGAPDSWLIGPSGRNHDTARGPDGPCSVAARPDGHHHPGGGAVAHVMISPRKYTRYLGSVSATCGGTPFSAQVPGSSYAASASSWGCLWRHYGRTHHP